MTDLTQLLRSRPDALCREAAEEIERLRVVISNHNTECVDQCEARKKAGRSYCPMQGYNRLCGDCPRDGMVYQAMKQEAA